DTFVIRIRRILKGYPVAPEDIHRPVDVVRSQRDVLNSLPTVFAQVFLDLALVVLRLVDGNADLAARARHGGGEQSGLLALDVEVADLAEVEQLLVEAGPEVHAPAPHVVREMVDAYQAGRLARRHGFLGTKIDIVDRALAIQIDQVDE